MSNRPDYSREDGLREAARLDAISTDEFSRAADAKRLATLLRDYAAMMSSCDDNHCKDCCCARVWAALGITGYTGKHVSEHVAELKSDYAALLARVEQALAKAAACDSDGPDYACRECMRESLSILRGTHD